MLIATARKPAALVASALLLSGCLGGGGSDAAGGAGSSKLENGVTNGTYVPRTNVAPTIAGAPASQSLVGQAYLFQPAASDKDGDPLTFTVSNLPSWLTFDPATGRLSGTPTAADVGQYANIQIAVSDGQATSTLGPFALVVVQAANGRATLSWQAPALNTDGSALTNLRGYRIYYGRSANQLDQSVSIDTAGITTYVIDNLTPATWYFVMTAVNADGVESDRTTAVTKVIG